MALTLSDTALIDEDEGKKSPEIPDTIDNDYLVSLIEASTIAVESYLGHVVIQRQIVERDSGGKHGARGGAKRIYLEHYPLVSLTSIEDDGSPAWTVDVDDVILWKDQGILEHRLSGFPAPNTGLWNITYTAGAATDRATTPWNYKEACRRLVAWILNQPNPGLALERLGETTIQYRDGNRGDGDVLMPDSVRMLLDAQRSIAV